MSADAEGALQAWPTLFASGGVVNPTEGSGGGATTAGPSPRLTAGVQWSVAGVYRASAIDDRAEAECATYRRFQELLAFIAFNKEGMNPAALRARATVYDEALPGAQAKVDAARAHA